MPFLPILAAASVLAGATAAVAGFGIGSVVTPVFALRLEMNLAVAAVAIPHAAATALRFWMLRRDVDATVVRTFGVMSAAGGLAGALLQQSAGSRALVVVFGGLLIFAGLTGITGLAARIRLSGTAGWIAGLLSGVFGGLVGNQGGIRSAALLGFGLSPTAFVSSATAVALMVDAARLPVYLATEGDRLLPLAPLIATATAGTMVGTLGGAGLLRRIPPPLFRTLVSALILVLGVYMLLK